MAMPIEHPAARSPERAAAIREPGGRRGFRQRRQRRFIVTSALAFAVFVIGATTILAWQWRTATLTAAGRDEQARQPHPPPPVAAPDAERANPALLRPRTHRPGRPPQP